jgi:hypothetical protein
VVAGVRGELLERERILREAASTEADSGPQERRSDPVVEADPLRDGEHVGAGRLAHVRDLVDERDARDQGRVRRELDHLRRRDVATDDGRVDARMQRLDDVGVRVLERADDDPVGVHEVPDRGPFGSELRVRDVADVLEAALVEPMTDGAAGAHRDGALHRQDDAAVDARELVDDRPDRGQIGVPGAGGRRADRDVDHVGSFDRLLDLRREGEPLPVALEQLVEPVLVDRELPSAQGVDLLGDDVAHDDVVPELGEAGTRDEADVAGAEDRDLHRGKPSGATAPEPSASDPWLWRAWSRSRAGRAAC